MFGLVSGLILWWAAHLLKRLAPGVRASMGGAGRGVVALMLVLSVLLMVLGYQSAAVIPLYSPFFGAGYANNLLMLFAVFLFGAGKSRGVMSQKIRHPMLSGMGVFALAHLLVNGDLASVILFAGLGLWALVQMWIINRQDGPWTPSGQGTIKGDIRTLVIALVMYGLIAAVHIWTGHNPFLGAY